MISEKFVLLIKNNTDEIVRYWCNEIKEHESTPTFHSFDSNVCIPYGTSVLKELGDWLDEKKRPPELRDYYINLGKRRALEGLPLEEVVSAHLLLKRHIWLFVLSHGFLSTAFELYQSLDLNNRVVNFFDHLIYYMIFGYETETTAKVKGMEHLYKGTTDY
jgi:hypothetical protein